MKMTKEEFLSLMRFPREWVDWEMFPEELFQFQISGYKRGHERASEHNRNGSFHWWLRQKPNKQQLKRLIALTYLDPDKGMAADVRKYISGADNCDQELLDMMNAQQND